MRTTRGRRASVSVIVEVQVMQDLQHFARASDYFLGKSNDQVGSIVLNVLQAHLQDIYEELSLKCIEEGIYIYMCVLHNWIRKGWVLEGMEHWIAKSTITWVAKAKTNKKPIPSICHGEPGIRTRAATIGGIRVSLSETLSLLHFLGHILLASVK